MAEGMRLSRRQALRSVLCCALELPLEDGARGDRGELVIRSVHVTDHHRRLVKPGADAQRGEIGDKMHVAKAALPVGEREAVDGVHGHVAGEQVRARVRARLGAAGDKVPRIHALAEEAPVDVGEADDDRLDGLALGELAQFRHSQQPPRLPPRLNGRLWNGWVSCVGGRGCIRPRGRRWPLLVSLDGCFRPHACQGRLDPGLIRHRGDQSLCSRGLRPS